MVFKRITGLKSCGYFITRVQEDAMKHLSHKFNKLYDKKQEVTIYLFSEQAYSLKKVKRNQSGVSCYCLSDSEKAKERVNKQWTEKECLETCEFRQAKGNQKPMCQDELTLKFLIPNVSKDRVWIFQTRSYHTINNIRSYINLQRQLGNKIQGYYKLFLFQKDTEKDGHKFRNYVADIIRQEEPILEEPQTVKTDISVITEDTATELEKKAFNDALEENSKKVTTIEPLKENPVNNTTSEVTEKEPSKPKKVTTRKPKKIEAITETKLESSDEGNFEITATEENLAKYYVLLETKTIELMKEGQKTEYIQGKFINKDDKELEIVLHPNFANEIAQCELR